VKTTKSSRHVGLIVLIMLSLVTAIIPTGAGAQGMQTCEDFGSPDIAQTILEVDPSLAEFLDPDGNGIACDHENDSTEDRAGNPKDDRRDEPTGDGDDYFADIEVEVDSVIATFNRYAEIDATFSDASEAEQQDMIVEIEEIAAFWSVYPDAAAEYEAPAGFEDVDGAYLDFAEAVGDTGDAWLIWWNTPAGDRNADAAFNDFVDAYDLAWDEADIVLSMVRDEAGGASDPKDIPTGEGDAYIVDIQGELDLLTEQVDRFLEISGLGADASDDDVDELNRIAAEWADYPEVASAYAAPDDFEVIEDAYLDLADSIGDAGELWEAYWAIPAANDEEEAVALDAFEDAFNDGQNHVDEVQELLDDAGGSDGPTDEPADDPSGDADAYLAAVSEHADGLNRDLMFFEAPTEEELDRYFTDFSEAPEVAASLDVPAGYEEIQDAYVLFTEQVALIPGLYDEWVEAGQSESLDDPALSTLLLAFTEATNLYETLAAIIEEFESGAASDTDVPTASDDPYLAYVRETVDSLNAELETFLEMMMPTNPSDPGEMEQILTNWLATPNAIMDLDVPADHADIQEAFEDYTVELANAAQYYVEWREAGEGDGRAPAFNNLMDSFEDAQEHYAALDSMLTEAGA